MDKPNAKKPTPCERAGGYGIALVLAMAFYVTSLGLTRIDPYAWFHATVPAVALSGAIMAAGILLNRPVLALLAPVGLVVWITGLNGSENAMDALMHPLMLAALIPGVVFSRSSAIAAATKQRRQMFFAAKP